MRDRPIRDPLMAADLETVRTMDLPCRRIGEAVYFSTKPHEVETAQDACLDCRVMFACGNGARDRAEPWGVWGGEVFRDGKPIGRYRGRGRPRKAG